MAQPRSHWQDLAEFEDIFPRILGKLSFLSRVRDTVLVCKRWSALCLANPPQDEHLEIVLSSPRSADHTYLQWIKLLGSAVKEVEITVPGTDTASHLPQTMLSRLLAVLALSLPAIRKLVIDLPTGALSIEDNGAMTRAQAVHWENFAAFLALFKQLERLDLYNVKFISDTDTSLRTWGDGYQHLLTENVFQGMQLKELNICNANEELIALPLHSVQLGVALKSLDTLTHLHLRIHRDKVTPAMDGISNQVASLTALRSLSLDINTRLHVPPQWSNLRSLTALYLAAALRDYPIISTLPDLSLKVLAVDFYGTRRDEEDEEDQLDQLLVPGCLTSLTRLEVSSNGCIFPEDWPILLPHDALKNMPGLVEFHLWENSFLASNVSTLGFIQSMPFLTKLVLRGCGLHQIPPVVQQLPRLELLDLTNNVGLQLDPLRDLALLKAVPRLRALSVASVQDSDRPIWAMATFKAITAIREQMPHLQLVLESGDDSMLEFTDSQDDFPRY